MSEPQINGFHAFGMMDFASAVEKDPAYREGREREKRQRIESLLTERLAEFQRAGYWRRQAILKKIHLQVNRELDPANCLF